VIFDDFWLMYFRRHDYFSFDYFFFDTSASSWCFLSSIFAAGGERCRFLLRDYAISFFSHWCRLLGRLLVSISWEISSWLFLLLRLFSLISPSKYFSISFSSLRRSIIDVGRYRFSRGALPRIIRRRWGVLWARFRFAVADFFAGHFTCSGFFQNYFPEVPSLDLYLFVPMSRAAPCLFRWGFFWCVRGRCENISRLSFLDYFHFLHFWWADDAVVRGNDWFSFPDR